MPPLVLGQLRFLFETLAAGLAVERLVHCVDAQVVLQVTALVEFAIAHAADQPRVQAVRRVIYYFFPEACDAVHLDIAGAGARLVLQLHQFEMNLHLAVVLLRRRLSRAVWRFRFVALALGLSGRHR